MKKISYIWSLVVGAAVVVWQVVAFYMRFGRMNTESGVIDYVLFFLAGAVGGLILAYFLNKQTSSRGWWIVMIAFLLAFPVAMVFILGGGMLLPFVGVIILPQIPWGIATWLGSVIGKRFA